MNFKGLTNKQAEVLGQMCVGFVNLAMEGVLWKKR